MSRGKHLSLEETRKSVKLDRFAKEHLTVGARALLDRLLGEISKTINQGAEHRRQGRRPFQRNSNFLGYLASARRSLYCNCLGHVSLR